VKAILVSHSHWDREWYRTFQDFRARLVDLVDRVLELCASDPAYKFLLDGQTVVIEDYLEIRPERRTDLETYCANGQIAIGPWYVQPDSLLPSGEAHVRNLLLGRRVGEEIGPVSRAGYTPDSFGHPAQFPQLFSGFGISSFIYWRGNGNEIDALAPEYDWKAPNGSQVIACHLGKGYFCAATAPGSDLRASGGIIAERARELAERTRSDVVLLLNGIDHAPPEPRTEALAKEIAHACDFDVQRGLLDDFVESVSRAPTERPSHSGELIGGRVAPLLPGVWSTRSWIKLANRQAEASLEGWAEPFAALGRQLGLPDERPALRLAWKELLKNQAHDSICGCSRDEVHEQMRSRFDAARELADQTARRCLERIAGLGPDRIAPRSDEFEVLVANPSPRSRTDLVRFPLDFHPYLSPSPNPVEAIHPTMLQDLGTMQFTVDEIPARLVPAETGRTKLLPERGGFDLEFIARDVPAMGFKRMRVRRAPAGLDTRDKVTQLTPGDPDAGVRIDDIQVSLRADGCFDARIGDSEFPGLGGLESTGDRGDSYDYDEVCDGPGLELDSVRAQARHHPSGIQELEIVRSFRMPAGLSTSREQRSSELATLEVETRVIVTPGVPRIDVDLRIENTARDHRLRMLFPVPGPVDSFQAATTFDVADRIPGPCDNEGWVQAAPPTFPHQGFVSANGLCIAAPGLPEAEVVAGESGYMAITLLRCVGSLSRADLRSRPGPAGPGTDTPNAQCQGTLTARLSIFAGHDPARVREAELGLRAVACGETFLVAENEPLVEIAPSPLLLSAFKPAENQQGIVLRLLNPTSTPVDAKIALGFPFDQATAIRLDEEPSVKETVTRDGNRLSFPVAPHALRTVLVT
jgi:mannosylglycerate hydrolase